MQQQTSFPDLMKGMVNQSITVIRNPSIAAFERYERSGTAVQAAIYVGIAALITGLLGLSGGIMGLVGNVVNTLLGFFIFTGLVYYIGRQQGGSGTFDEVAYTFSLFWAPLSVIIAVVSLILLVTIVGIVLIPLWLLVGLLINAYFAYLSVQSSMNLTDGTRILITLGGAVIGSILIRIVLGMLGL